jgi:hypothetical protein
MFMGYINKFKEMLSRPLLSLELIGSILVLYGVLHIYWLATDSGHIVFDNYWLVIFLIVLGVFLILKNVYAWSLVLFSSFKEILLASILALFFSLIALFYYTGKGHIDGVNNFNGIYFYVSIFYYFLLSDEVLEYFKMDGYTKWLRGLRRVAFFSACIYALTYGFDWFLI